MQTPKRMPPPDVDSPQLLFHLLDVRLELDLGTYEELLEAVDRCMADNRRLKTGEVAKNLCKRHRRQSPVIGKGVALLNAEIRHLRPSRLLYLRSRTPVVLAGQEVTDFFVLLAAFPASIHDHDLLEYLRNNVPRRAFLESLRACSRSDTVHSTIRRFLALMPPGLAGIDLKTSTASWSDSR